MNSFRGWAWTIPSQKSDAAGFSRLVCKDGTLTGVEIQTLVDGWGQYQDARRKSAAALIATAPDLLAALKAMLDYYAPGATPNTVVLANGVEIPAPAYTARAAIAKATGDA